MNGEALQEKIKNYINFNCKFCKNVNFCELYPFLVTPGSILKMDITSENYVCSNIEKDHGAKITKIKKVDSF